MQQSQCFRMEMSLLWAVSASGGKGQKDPLEPEGTIGRQHQTNLTLLWAGNTGLFCCTPRRHSSPLAGGGWDSFLSSLSPCCPAGSFLDPESHLSREDSHATMAPGTIGGGGRKGNRSSDKETVARNNMLWGEGSVGESCSCPHWFFIL